VGLDGLVAGDLSCAAGTIDDATDVNGEVQAEASDATATAEPDAEGSDS
jgi:hypothetical protein